jgi:hypothetical protein
VALGFEGGQMPLHRRLPKLKGFSNAAFTTSYQVVNTGRLAELYPDGGDVTPDDLVASGAVRPGSLIKVLGTGDARRGYGSARTRSPPAPVTRSPQRAGPPPSCNHPGRRRGSPPRKGPGQRRRPPALAGTVTPVSGLDCGVHATPRGARARPGQERQMQTLRVEDGRC